jgi:predicted small metal-binding protein
MMDPILRLRCACGWEATGSEDELVAATQEHGRRMHNMSASRAEVLAMILRDDELSTAADEVASGDAGDM